MKQPGTFVLALGVVAVWAFTGPLFQYSDTWLLAVRPHRSRSRPSCRVPSHARRAATPAARVMHGSRLR